MAPGLHDSKITVYVVPVPHPPSLSTSKIVVYVVVAVDPPEDTDPWFQVFY